MRILLVDIDSRIPNLALRKIQIYHKADTVEYVRVPFHTRPRNWSSNNIKSKLKGILPYVETAARTYVSCLFKHNRPLAEEISKYKNTIIGGPGWDILAKLPEDIDKIVPRINMGYTTRGCNRNCEFCIIPRAEGRLRVVGDIKDFWDGKAKAVSIMDNNILQAPDHFWKIAQQLCKHNLRVDFMQGLDIRCVDRGVCKILETLKFEGSLKFAFDNPNMYGIVEEKILLMREYKIPRDLFFYVLCGFNTTFEEDKKRVEWLVSKGCDPYVMKHENIHFDSRYRRLTFWANKVWPQKMYGLDEWLKKSDKGANNARSAKDSKKRKCVLRCDTKTFPLGSKYMQR